jgi:hypothetical protein
MLLTDGSGAHAPSTSNLHDGGPAERTGPHAKAVAVQGESASPTMLYTRMADMQVGTQQVRAAAKSLVVF